MNKAIICVDDEKIVLDSLKAQLTRKYGRDYEIEFAESADEAFEILEDLAEEGIVVFAVVSDWLMPGMKGDAFLIKVHEKYPEVNKVLLTGQADKDAVENARQNAKLNAVLAKPWDEGELFQALAL